MQVALCISVFAYPCREGKCSKHKVHLFTIISLPLDLRLTAAFMGIIYDNPSTA